jgi:histidinol phosphatase-like PHP family hydrolase
MRSTPPLLCELHAHTTWSDGSLSVRELVDLYGGAGFNVLAVTDHVLRPGESQAGAVRAPTYDQYLDDLQAEGERALATYGLLLVPGLELTYDDPDPRLVSPLARDRSVGCNAIRWASEW